MKNILKFIFIFSLSTTLGQSELSVNDSILKKLISDYSVIIKNNTSFDSLYYWRSFLYYLNNEIDSAFIDINNAIDISPEKPAFYRRKGYYYRKFGIYDSAIMSYQKALYLDTLHSNTYLMLIDCYIHLRDYDNAMKYFKKGSGSVIYSKSNTITVTSGLYPDLYIIANLYERGYNADTTQYKALYGAGYAFFVREEYDSSYYYLEKYLQKTPLDSVIADLYSMLGTLYLNNDDIDNAKRFFNKAYEKGCDLPEIVQAMIGTIDKNDPVYFYYKGVEFFNDSRNDSSLSYLKKYESMIPSDSIITNTYYLLGVDYLIVEDTINAIKYLKKAKITNPDMINELFDNIINQDVPDSN